MFKRNSAPPVEDLSMDMLRLPLPHELENHERSDNADKATIFSLLNSGLATFRDADLLHVDKANLVEQQAAILNKANALNERDIKVLPESAISAASHIGNS
jgi:hypothetical protein